jgi:hypothetical protein
MCKSCWCILFLRWVILTKVQKYFKGILKWFGKWFQNKRKEKNIKTNSPSHSRPQPSSSFPPLSLLGRSPFSSSQPRPIGPTTGLLDQLSAPLLSFPDAWTPRLESLTPRARSSVALLFFNLESGVVWTVSRPIHRLRPAIFSRFGLSPTPKLL